MFIKDVYRARRFFDLCVHRKYGVVLYFLRDLLGLKRLFLPMPAELMIEPANICNAHCPTCPTGAGKMNRPARMMTLTEFRRIVDQSGAYGGTLILWGYGEPLMNPELLSMVRYASDKGLHVITSTNGQLVDSEALCREIIGSGLKELIISLDGADQETYGKFRVGCQVDRTLQAIKWMSLAKKESSAFFPKVTVQFIAMKHNVHQAYLIKKLAMGLGADSYVEKTVDIDMNDPEFHGMAQDLVPEDLARRRFCFSKDGACSLKGEAKGSCSWISRRIVINSDGSVVPCGYDRYSENVMGNVLVEGLADVWQGEKYVAFRRKFYGDRRALSLCTGCPVGRGIPGLE